MPKILKEQLNAAIYWNPANKERAHMHRIMFTLLAAHLVIGSLSACARSEREASAPSAEKRENILQIQSAQELDDAVAKASGLVLVDFWASWCPPCRFMNPILAEVAAELPDTLVVAKVDVDRNRELAERYKIESIPTFILFKNGQAVDMKIGAFPKADLLKWLAAHRG